MIPALKAIVSGKEANKIYNKDLYRPDAVLVLSVGVFAPVRELSIHFSRNTIKDYREMEATEASIDEILSACEGLK